MAEFTGDARPLTQSGFDTVSQKLGGDAASLWSLLTVETKGFGFQPDRRPKILFERHIFHKRTGGKYSAAHPDISSETAGGYGPEGVQYERLGRAIELDRKAALESTSWGLAQIMGFNAVGLGYPSAEAMIGAFTQGEDAQVDGARRFITSNSALASAFKSRNWDKVAFYYNGAAYAKNDYHTKLAQYHEVYATKGLPSIEIRAAQARLLYLGYDPHGVDGLLGGNTRAAVAAFQKARTLPITGELDPETRQQLQSAAKV